MRFYHVTSVECLDSIAKEGLRPGAYLIAEDGHCADAIRRYYGETVSDEGKRPALLTVDLAGLDDSLLEPDFPGLEEPLTFTLGMSEKEVWSAWARSKKTWSACVELVGTCRYSGGIAPSAIQFPPALGPRP